MPDFTFTSPEGRNYTVTGPEGSTKEQAFQILQQQLSAGTAKEDAGTTAAVPATTPAATSTAHDRVMHNLEALRPPITKPGALDEPTSHPTLGSAASAIGQSTFMGGALGAMSPEILQGLGAAATALGQPEIGLPMIEAGTAMKGGRMALAATGAVSGMASEAGGQLVEAAGGTKGQAEAARIAGGFVSPSAGMVEQFVPKAGKVAWKLVQKLLGNEVPEGSKAVEAAKSALSKLDNVNQPRNAVHAMLQQGVELDRQAAEAAGRAHIEAAGREVSRLAATDAEAAIRHMDETRTTVEKMRAEAAARATTLNKAAGGKLATANRVLAMAEPELKNVGQVRELSDIGTDMRNSVMSKYGAELQARGQAYKQTLAERDAIVQRREAAGETVDNTQGMKDLKAFLGKQTLSTAVGRAAAKGLKPVAEPGIVGTYARIQDALATKRFDTGMVDANGQPIVQTFKNSFDALDQIRRKLGDVVKNRDVEGFSTLTHQQASDLYARISKIQEEFVGTRPDGTNIQKELQEGYAGASGELAKFETKLGKKATALDRVNMEQFAGDAKSLPKNAFQSQQSVRDLKELVGNPEQVNRMAGDYAARSLQGQDAKQVGKWLRENRDWTREIPGLTERVQGYQQKLEQIERVNQKLGQRAKGLTGAAAEVRPAAEAAAAKEMAAGTSRAAEIARGSVDVQKRLQETAQKEVQQLVTERFAPSQKLQGILQSAEAPGAVRKLLLEGSPEQTRLAAKHLSAAPGGQQVLEGSVREVLSGLSEGQLKQKWSEQVLPMLTEGKMLPPERLKALQGDVERVLRAYKGPEKVKLVQMYVAAALGESAGRARRAVEGY